MNDTDDKGEQGVSKVIGITGGAGAGKTTLGRCLQQRGVPVITADEVGRQVVQKGSPVLQALVTTFGRTVLTPKGHLDRRKVGHWVFQNPTALQRLNQLTHPPMRSIIEERLRELKARGCPLIGVEAAVLFEMGLRKNVDEVWVVSASERERLKRLEMGKWGNGETGRRREETAGMGQRRWEALRRMRRQLPEQVFIRRAYRVIVTDGRWTPNSALIKLR